HRLRGDTMGSIVLGRFVSPSGLQIVHQRGDGRTRPVVFGGREGHELFPHPTNPGSPNPFMYFQLAQKLTNRIAKLLVTVEYCDVTPGSFGIHYDGNEGMFTASRDKVQLTGDQKWHRATFVLDQPRFERRQNGEADF